MNEQYSLNKDRLKMAIALLDKHFSDPHFLVKTWATLMMMSDSNFSRLMRHETKQSPLVHLRNKRLEQAQNLLKHTNQSVTDVAIASGFNDNNYFSRIFKQFFKLSPTDWRKVNHTP
jgi:transcriptional regulator GlxA family with amidase domain